MKIRNYRSLGLTVLFLALPFGCGKDDDGPDATGGTGGGAGASAGGSGGASATGGSKSGGTGGKSSGTSGTGPTGCEGLSPMTGEECDDTGLVCPNALGSCVCQRDDGERAWECFEIGGGEGGSTGSLGGQGPGGEGPGGATSGGAGTGEGGDAQGGGANGGTPAGGAGGEGGEPG